MKIDKKSFKLTANNYHSSVYEKDRVILCNSFSNDMSFINGWVKRSGGSYTATTPFTIDKDGVIYQHYNPKYYSDIVEDDVINQVSIGITLVNAGWLKEHSNGVFYNLRMEPHEGDKIKQYWRGFLYWDVYTDAQYNSLNELLEFLTKNFGIYKKTVDSNIKRRNAILLKGVTSRSNYGGEFTDISPAFEMGKIIYFKDKKDD